MRASCWVRLCANVLTDRVIQSREGKVGYVSPYTALQCPQPFQPLPLLLVKS